MAMSKKSCLTSIIIPTHKRHQKLSEAIFSVINQTVADWEVVVVSDGDDRVAEQIVNDFLDPRIRYLSTPWIGLSGNHQRNVGAVLSRGEFLLFLDDDNLLYPSAIDIFRSGFSSPDIGFVVCPIHYQGKGIIAPDRNLEIKGVDTLNFMIRRDALGKAGLWKWFYEADHDLITRISKISRGVYLDVQPIGIHR